MMFRKMPQFKAFNYEEFVENWLLISSRTFNIELEDSEEMVKCIIPYADMFNQRYTKMTS